MMPSQGQTIRGYELREQLGVGGFGAVYRAYQTLLKREVAVKVILPHLANDPEFVRRFEVEAELIARLEHPHIVPLFDYWREADGAYLVMRLLRGGSLRDELKKGKLAPESVVRVYEQMTSALHIAHRNGVIHRDIKPANMLLDEDGNAYLTDFGIAKTSDYQSQTGDGISGSIPYISPEQLQNGTISPQTDIYALGVMLYELLAGKHPFESSTITEMIMLHMSEPLPDITLLDDSLPYEVHEVIQQATAKNPDERYDDVRDLAIALQAAFSGEILTDFSSFIDLNGDATPIVLHNPYKGLQAFQEVDAEQFFGRGDLVEKLVNRLSENEPNARFLMLIGASGSGKSSVVRAGLLPALRAGALTHSQRWFYTDMFPGSHPFIELEAALSRIAMNPLDNMLEQLQVDGGLLRVLKHILPSDDSELVLVIDQFEELFTQVHDDETRERFLNNLVSAVQDSRSRIRIIVTMRADFYDQPLHYHDFAEMMQSRLETVLPLTRDELRQAVVMPAEQVGAQFQGGLVDTIIKDVNDQPGMLPLLQYALTELIEHQVGATVTLETYTQIGGVSGALAKRAESLFQQMNTNEQALIKQIFLRLVSVGEGTEDTRRRVNRSELPVNDATEQILQSFAKHRLLTFDRDLYTRETTVEIAHEALIRSWQRLQSWIEEDRDSLLIQRRLIQATQDWLEANKDPGFLALESRLVQFELWSKNSDLQLSADERLFLQESLQERDAREQLKEARKEHELNLQRQAANRLRYLAIVLVVGLLVSVGLTFFAFGQQQVATEQTSTAVAERDRADLNARLSQSRALAVNGINALNDDEVDLALLLSVEALNTADTYEARNSLMLSLTEHPHLEQYLHAHSDRVRTVDYSPSGDILASGGADYSVFLWDVAKGQVMGMPLVGHSEFVIDVKFSPDGTILASASGDKTIILWDVATRERIGQALIGHSDEVWTVDFSPDGTLLASTGEDGMIILWNVESQAEVRRIEPESGEMIFSLTFSADGAVLASGGQDNLVQLWDVATGEQYAEPLQGHGNWIRSLDFYPDGALLASSDINGMVYLWNLGTGESSAFQAHDSWISAVQFSPDGQWLASIGNDESLKLWNLAEGSNQSWSLPETTQTNDFSWQSDSQHIATGDDDGNVIIWNTHAHAPLSNTRIAMDSAIYATQFDISSKQFVVVDSSGQSIRISDDGDALDALSVNAIDAISGAVSPSGDLVAFGNLDGSVDLWSIIDQQPRKQTLEEHSNIIFALTFSEDASVLASSDDDGKLIIWNTQTGQMTGQATQAHSGGIRALAFNSSGTLLASGGEDNQLIVYDVETGQVMKSASHEDRVLSVAFSADGTRIASGDRSGNVIVWDVETMQPVHQFSVSGDEIYAITFSPDNRYLVAGGYAQVIRIWDLQRGSELGNPLIGHNAIIQSLAFSADGSQLISGDRSGNVILWEMNPQQWIASACSRANRNLTPLEWEQFIPEFAYRVTCSPQ